MLLLLSLFPSLQQLLLQTAPLLQLLPLRHKLGDAIIFSLLLLSVFLWFLDFS